MYDANPFGTGFGTIVFNNISPSAGTDASWTVPTGKIWAPMSCVVKLTTTGGGSAREVLLWATNSTTDSATEALAQVVPNTTQASGITRSYEWSLGLGYEKSATTANTGHMSMFEIYVAAGYKIRTKVVNLGGSDTWDAAWIYVLEYVSPS